jgi:prepilin-type N-terminal cleavage/methylation domain-containing protein
MAQKYTILKAITRTSNKGFTLLELLVGMIITLIIGGLAMQAFINASAMFSKDKKTIESDQNLSAVLEIIGNDIRQAGENISDVNFPAIEISPDPASTKTPPSSKITIRRALSEQLTLCEDLPANPTSTTTILVTNTTKSEANCKVTQLLGSRSTPTSAPVFYPLPISPAPTTALTPLLPGALRKARDYRCQIPDPNRDYNIATTDFCDSLVAPFPKVKVAVSDTNGHLFIFNQIGESVDTANNAADTVNPNTYNASIFKKYSITVDTAFNVDDSTQATINNNNLVAYVTGNPIYLIEERVYTLDNSGNLLVSVDGKTPSTLIKKIDKFTVSARLYTNTLDKIINPTPTTPAIPCDTTNSQFASTLAVAPYTTTNPRYTCKFNGRVLAAAVPPFTAANPADPVYNWKTLAGVKIQVQGQYDGRGQNATPSQTDLDKITAASEFFPRNVLSK